MKKVYALALVLAAACVGLPATGLAAGQVVTVTLKDFSIALPKSLPAGPVTLRVTNAGQADHNLEIRGQGVNVRLPHDLASGQSSTLQVNLRPGLYTVRCPVPEHAEAGMQEQLLVDN